MTRVASRKKSPELWTVRMLHEDLGVPMATAETIFHRIALDYNALVRPAGVRRRFVTRKGYEAWRRASGLPLHSESGNG